LRRGEHRLVDVDPLQRRAGEAVAAFQHDAVAIELLAPSVEALLADELREAQARVDRLCVRREARGRALDVRACLEVVRAAGCEDVERRRTRRFAVGRVVVGDAPRPILIPVVAFRLRSLTDEALVGDELAIPGVVKLVRE